MNATNNLLSFSLQADAIQPGSSTCQDELSHRGLLIHENDGENPPVTGGFVRAVKFLANSKDGARAKEDRVIRVI